MKRFLFGTIVVICSYTYFIQHAFSQSKSVFIEDLTWTEIRDEIDSGKTTAIYFSGSTEQNGSHLVLGKHNFISRYVAEKIANELGSALVYPVMPFAPTGDPVAKTDHMRYPGSVNLSEERFAAVAHDVAISAISSGFKNVVLMGDHGGGQKALEAVAASLDSEWTEKGVHVFYIQDVYFKAKQEMRKYLSDHDLPSDVHAGIDDTSELLFIDNENKWVRKEKLQSENETEKHVKGINRASMELGKIFIGFKVKYAVDQIRLKLAKHK
jgi:creatinine amidohydrolase